MGYVNDILVLLNLYNIQVYMLNMGFGAGERLDH